MPEAPSASVKPGKGAYFGYTGVGSVLDYAVAIVSVGKAVRLVDEKSEEQKKYEPISDMDRQICESCECGPLIYFNAAVEKTYERPWLITIAER